MNGRYGTSAEVLIHSRAMDIVLDAADKSTSDDVRIGVYLGGRLSSDDCGGFYEVTEVLSSAEGAVGLALTSADGDLEPSAADVASLIREVGKGVLMIVDPYACQFTVNVVDSVGVHRANSILLE